MEQLEAEKAARRADGGYSLVAVMLFAVGFITTLFVAVDQTATCCHPQSRIQTNTPTRKMAAVVKRAPACHHNNQVGEALCFVARACAHSRRVGTYRSLWYATIRF